MKLSFALNGPSTTIKLNYFIQFNRMKVKKIRYKTSHDYTGIIYISIMGVNQHVFINTQRNDTYFFSLFPSDQNSNQMLYKSDDNEDWDYKGGDIFLKEIIIQIFNDGVFENNINLNNPIFIELEYE